MAKQWQICCVLGLWLAWNVGERVQAYTHPLWMFVISAGVYFTHEFYFTSLALSILVSLAAAAVLARFVATNLIKKGLAKKALVSVAYAIGRAEPVMIEAVNEKGEDLSDYVKENFDFRPLAIIERLNLRRPIYQESAAYGHFGKNLPWG